MRAVLTICLLLLFAPARAQQTRIDMKLADDGSLHVSYTVPAGVGELRLADRSPAAQEVWRHWAKTLDDCATVVNERIQIRPSCTQARFAIQPNRLNRDAAYEPALPVGSQGVAVYLRYYATSDSPMLWRWRAPPQGYVLHQGQIARDVVEELEPAAQIVFLGSGSTYELPGGVLVADAALDDERLAQVRGHLSSAMNRLTQLYAAMPAGPAGVIITTSVLPGIKFDTSPGRMMLLRVPVTPEPQRDLDLAFNINHEVTHFWNSGVYRSDTGYPWIHEGHAEWMALLLTQESGRMNARLVAERLEWAINRCVTARGSKPAAAWPKGMRGSDPYDCGMTLMMAAQLERAVRMPGLAPLALAASLHKGRDAILSQQDVAAWADGADNGPMRSLLFDPKLGFSAGLQALLGDFAVVQSEAVVEPVPVADREWMSVDLLMTPLMKRDCGSTDFFSIADGFRVADSLQLKCEHLRKDQIVEQLEGIPMRTQPVAALLAMRASCAQGNTVRIRNRDGSEDTLACPTPLPEVPVKSKWRLKPEALEMLGLSS